MSTGPLLPLPSKVITIMRCLDLWFLSPLGTHDSGLKFASVFRRIAVQHTMALKRQRWSHIIIWNRSMPCFSDTCQACVYISVIYIHMQMQKHNYVYVFVYFKFCICIYSGEMRCGSWPMVPWWHGEGFWCFNFCFFLFFSTKWSFNNLCIGPIGTSAQFWSVFFSARIVHISQFISEIQLWKGFRELL